METGVGYNNILWDQWYESGDFASNWDTPWPSPELAGFVAAHDWSTGERAIDLGCGTGADAIYLASLGFEAFGVDICAPAIELAEQRGAESGHSVSWLLADACDVPLPSGSASLITDVGCLHHFSRDEWGAYASEVARLLRPGGLLFVRGVHETRRDENVLSIDSIHRHFDSDEMRVVRTRPFELVGSHGRHCAGTIAVVERR